MGQVRQRKAGGGCCRSAPNKLTLALFLALATPAHAVPYSIPDARGLALGGATVALSNSHTAALYNPALLARHSEQEDESGENSLMVPIVSATVGDPALELADYQDDDLHDQMQSAINTYNATLTAAAAQNVANASADLNNALNAMANREITGDLSGGLVIGIPSLAAGGSFFALSRVIGVGVIELTDHDQALLNDYIEGMTFVASGGANGVEHPELFDTSGQLLDLTDTLDSIIHGRGLVSTEVGVALATTTRWNDWDINLGVAPKIQGLTTYDYLHTVHDDSASFSRSERTETALNVDLGLSVSPSEHWLVGLSVKNLFSRKVTTALGNDIHLQPHVRAGASYESDRFRAGGDIDILSNNAIDVEDDNQSVGAGAEWDTLSWLKLRAGAQVDMRNASTHNLITFGVGLAMKSFVCDVAVGKGTDSQMAAVQFGFLF